MRYAFARAALAAVIALAAACGDASQSSTSPDASPALARSASQGSHSRQGFGFNGTVSGFPTGVVFLTGGGSFDIATASNVVPTDTRVSGGGGFRCTDAVAQGPLNGCAAGEGVRWDSVQLLASTNFKCSPADVAKPAVTGTDRVVLLADFYRAGDGVNESFTAQMIVSTRDIANDIPGIQNVWIQSVGCGAASVSFGA